MRSDAIEQLGKLRQQWSLQFGGLLAFVARLWCGFGGLLAFVAKKMVMVLVMMLLLMTMLMMLLLMVVMVRLLRLMRLPPYGRQIL